ncbi:MAG TPA: metallophosphoesterase family protein [Chthoniobacteraceae bacterium]|jgi:putative phosphoesterase|nr:metallophosphoesterase family protein [Chthoniobacteraceae bacterium]
MKIAVVSDTHDRIAPGLTAAIRDADEIWHLGDVCSPTVLEEFRRLGPPLLVVRGNCDSEKSWPLTLRLERGGLQFQLIHIPPATAPAGVDLLLHGHTHVPRNELIGKTRFLNPGCITRPNRGAPASLRGWRSSARSRSGGRRFLRRGYEGGTPRRGPPFGNGLGSWKWSIGRPFAGLQQTQPGPDAMKSLGYNQPLYILPFDHRGSFETKLFGWHGDLTPAQTGANEISREAAVAEIASRYRDFTQIFEAARPA